jgi:hypothetical protein
MRPLTKKPPMNGHAFDPRAGVENRVNPVKKDEISPRNAWCLRARRQL